MKNTKKRIEMFSFFDYDGISSHLEKMAAKGWMIDRITNFSWVYRRIEPKKVKFAVSCYPNADEFDPEFSDEQKNFYEFCAHTGWELACASAQLQIFYNERENPTPIETEPTLKVENIHATAKKGFISYNSTMLLVGFLQFGLCIAGLIRDPIGQLANYTKMFMGFFFVALTALSSIELIRYFRWYKKARQAAEQGEFLKSVGTSKFQKGFLIAVSIAVICWAASFMIYGDRQERWVGVFLCVCIPAIFILVNSVTNFLKHKKVSAEVNRTLTKLIDIVLIFAVLGGMTVVILKYPRADETEETYEHNGKTWVVHRDELPLNVEDLMEVDYDGYIKERTGEESLLLGKFVMRQSPRLDAENFRKIPRMEYTMVFVKVPALYNICKNRLIYEGETLHTISKNNYEAQDAAAWGANEAYCLFDRKYGPQNDYLLCYDDVLVQISFPMEPTPEQKKIVGEKLGAK